MKSQTVIFGQSQTARLPGSVYAIDKGQYGG